MEKEKYEFISILSLLHQMINTTFNDIFQLTVVKGTAQHTVATRS